MSIPADPSMMRPGGPSGPVVPRGPPKVVVTVTMPTGRRDANGKMKTITEIGTKLDDD